MQEQRATTALERAINSQPEQLERLLTHDEPRLHEAAERLHRCRRLWLVGTGTSQHAAELGAAMLQEAGRGAVAVPSMHFVTWPPFVTPQDGVILISHNAGAETAYVAAGFRQAVNAGIRVVAITRQNGELPDSIETVPKEESETYTVSYSGALIILARIAAALGSDTAAADTLAKVPGAVRAAIADPGIQRVPRPRRLLLLYGAGPASVTAREGALKLREASRTLCEGYDAEYLLHGSAVPLTAEDHMVALSPPDPDGFVSAVARAAEAEGIGVTTVVEPADLPPLLAQIPLTARLQLLALRFAEDKGENPDRVITGAWGDPALWSIGSP
ncbi:MAG TPA: SIS domain-containing protein [Actinomycetota bacterium]|nr:SIS domain-containing protein [Actinomycetota bacterium]